MCARRVVPEWGRDTNGVKINYLYRSRRRSETAAAEKKQTPNEKFPN